MADKKTRADNLHDQMPAVFGTRANPNWKAIIDSIGDVDQETLDLIEAVREQFFIKTADRPYLDRLGTANLVQRPNFVGMNDSTFREFIPIMSYQPKQVKIIMDKILDIFFFKESTTSFVSSGLTSPFNLTDGWELEYTIDDSTSERIKFTTEEFTNINAATANEVVASINRQSTNSYAITFENSITKLTNIRIFTNTIGSKGSVKVTGGRANIGLQFDGYNTEAGNGVGTEWTISTIGDTVTMLYTGTGGTPNIDKLQIGDVVIITRTGNVGSFEITEVNATDNTIKYINLFATAETFIQSSTNDVKFMTPLEANVYLKDRRAVVWEVKPGEIVVEMPPTPPVVQRRRIGAAHINGIESLVADTPTTSSLELTTISRFPSTGGRFFYIPLNEIQTFHPIDSTTDTFTFKSKLSSDLPVYTYTGISSNTLTGVTPTLPTTANTAKINLVSANRDASNTITVTTAAVHDYVVGEYAIIEGAGEAFNNLSTDLDGSNDYVDMGSDSSLNFKHDTPFSISLWLKRDTLTDDFILSSRDIAGGAPFPGIECEIAFNQVFFSMVGDNGTGVTGRTNTGVMPTGSWVNFTITYDGSSSFSGLTMYKDGVSLALTLVSDNATSVSTTPGSFALGARNNGSGPINGKLDEVAIWNKELSLSEVTEVYNSGSTDDLAVHSATANIISWLRMGDGDTFPTITDKVGTNDGTMINMDAGDFISDTPPSATVLTNTNGTWKITAINSTTEFEAFSFLGPSGVQTSTNGTVRVERLGTATSGGKVILTSAQIEDGLEGPFIWDESSDFILSSLTTNLTTKIDAGSTERNIQVGVNSIPDAQGRLIFDFGTAKQEGPVRYFFKPTSTSLTIDPSHVFGFSHDIGSSVTMIRRRGGIEFTSKGTEHAAYITDPAAARVVLQDLMEEVKSVGIFINFLIRYPEQFYATIDVYNSGIDPG